MVEVTSQLTWRFSFPYITYMGKIGRVGADRNGEASSNASLEQTITQKPSTGIQNHICFSVKGFPSRVAVY